MLIEGLVVILVSTLLFSVIISDSFIIASELFTTCAKLLISPSLVSSFIFSITDCVSLIGISTIRV